MATRVRIEYGNINRPNTASPNLMTAIPTTAVHLVASTTATASGSRPAVPSGFKYAFITAVDGHVIVLAGSNPTAVQTSGKLCYQGIETPVPVVAGQLLSFIELAAAF